MLVQDGNDESIVVNINCDSIVDTQCVQAPIINNIDTTLLLHKEHSSIVNPSTTSAALYLTL